MAHPRSRINTKCNMCRKKIRVVVNPKDFFCTKECKERWNRMWAEDYQYFGSYSEASKHYNLSEKVVHQYENVLYSIDPTLYIAPGTKFKKCRGCGKLVTSSKARHGFCKECSSKGIGCKIANKATGIKQRKLRTCILCGASVPSAQCRRGYCKKCTSEGLGHKEGGKKLSVMFSGEGNPNFVHGNYKQSLSQRLNQWYKWGRFVFKNCNYRCVLSGRGDELQCHHIIPFSVGPLFRFLIENGVVLNRFYHIELHRQRLDLLLLSNLAESVKDAQGLIEWFVHQPQVQSLLELPYVVHDKHELIRVVGKNHCKQLSSLLPEFDPFSLDHLLLQ